MDDDIKYPAMFTIIYPDGTSQHLNRKEMMELIEIPPNSFRDAICAAEIKKIINDHSLLVKEEEEINKVLNVMKVIFKFVFNDDTKEEV